MSKMLNEDPIGRLCFLSVTYTCEMREVMKNVWWFMSNLKIRDRLMLKVIESKKLLKNKICY